MYLWVKSSFLNGKQQWIRFIHLYKRLPRRWVSHANINWPHAKGLYYDSRKRGLVAQTIWLYLTWYGHIPELHQQREYMISSNSWNVITNALRRTQETNSWFSFSHCKLVILHKSNTVYSDFNPIKAALYPPSAPRGEMSLSLQELSCVNPHVRTSLPPPPVTLLLLK